MTDNVYRPAPAEIISIVPQTEIDWTFRLDWADAPEAGQFYQVSLPRLGEAPFSVCDWGADWIDITIRNVGRVTSGIFRRKVGEHLFVRGPYGKPFPMDRFYGKHVIVAAGGTGLAPVKGMICRLLGLEGKPDRRAAKLDILTGFKSPNDILFADELEEWKADTRVWTTVDHPTPHWDGHTGVITTLVPELPIETQMPDAVIVVGPPLMMRFTVQAFEDVGIPLDRIWVSYERRMSCGLGKCGRCKIADTYVCLEGPVFNASEAQWLMD